MRSKVAILTISLACGLLTTSGYAQQRTPIGTENPDQVAELADALCRGSGYIDYGYNSYAECYADVINTYPIDPAGEGSGGMIWLPGGPGYDWIFCGRLGCY